MTAQSEDRPLRSQSSTSLSVFYNGGQGVNVGDRDEETVDPALDFCNAFWGHGDKGYEVVMARLRGAGRTVDELRSFWKERAAIEEEYAKRLSKLAKFPLGRDEIGDLAASLQTVLVETSAQASYHLSLSAELRNTVEQPTAEFANRLNNLKKGLQASVEKSWRNKGLQESHVAKARERYESDCLKLNSLTANASLVQGKELEKIQMKLDRVRQTIGTNEQDFRNFVRVLEGTRGKWENEWKQFCDHVQDLEEDRLAMTKDVVWAYANAVSQVCVEDDSSCERIREKLEQFDPGNDMINFVRGWGTGPSIPDPPPFIDYGRGQAYPSQQSYHTANFRRISSRPASTPLGGPGGGGGEATPQTNPWEPTAVPPPAAPEPEPIESQSHTEPEIPSANVALSASGLDQSINRLSLRDEPVQLASGTKPPFGGIALPGMATAGIAAAATVGTGAGPTTESKPFNDMPPPPVPPTMTMPEPRVPSRQGPPTPKASADDEEDPMARALAELRRDPPPPASVRRAQSHRRPESMYMQSSTARTGQDNSNAGVKSPASPTPWNNRMSYQPNPVTHSAASPVPFQTPASPSAPSAASIGLGSQAHRQSVDMTLSPPAPGHTAAQLAKSMADFERQSKRSSVNYSNFADDIVGAHPSSRPASPAPSNTNRAPSPAMMQPPIQPPSPVADEVLSQYHQAFPGERERHSRSRAGSVVSSHSRAPSFANVNAPSSPLGQNPPLSPGGQHAREGFVGIGTGTAAARSSSPQPPVFRSPSPSPTVPQHSGALGPQNLGIALDERGGVAHDSMAEAYRRQYQEQQQQQHRQSFSQPPQQQQQQHQQQPQHYVPPAPPPIQTNLSQYGQAPYQQQPYNQAPKSPISSYTQQGGQQARTSTYGAESMNQPQHPQSAIQQPHNQFQPPQQYQPPPPPQPQAQAYQTYQPPQQQQQQHMYGYQSTQQPPISYNMQPQSPQQPHQQAQQPQYGYPYGYANGVQQHHDQMSSHSHGPPAQARTPSPQPGVPPQNAQPTGQWSTNGLPVLFYVKALYDYQAQTPAEFDFQQGDIIAVTSTPEDGWWSGELLDEARRSPGRTDFPSNFVCLF